MIISDFCNRLRFKVDVINSLSIAIYERRMNLLIRMFTPLGLSLVLVACQQTHVRHEPLPQRGYLWQRSWNPAVEKAVTEADSRMDGLIVLGAEIQWKGGELQVIRANIRWDTLKSMKKSCSLALRVAPYPGPFEEDDRVCQAIIATAKGLLEDARLHGVEVREFQLDFDCAQKKLSGYRKWIHAVRTQISPTRFVITTLPSWLKETEFRNLIYDVDGYVLQVHSVPTQKESGRASLCDVSLARKWVSQAESLGVPFSVALPTYRCLAGYDETGKLRGVMMDSIPLAWPTGTHVLEFGSNPDDIAALVDEWHKTAPATLQEIIWYRLPVETDRLNWQWKTLSAVMEGRKSQHKLEVSQRGTNPIDLAISNLGETDDSLPQGVRISWDKGVLIASDALEGWSIQQDAQSVTFTPLAGFHPHLPPDSDMNIGWLRFNMPITLRTEILNENTTH